MKARHIRKARKIIERSEEFTVSVRVGWFDFDDDYNGHKRVVLALDATQAIRRYFRWWYRHFKEVSKYYSDGSYVCTRDKGRIMVINSKGYKSFYQ